MTEREFREHLADLDEHGDPADRAAHYAKVTATLLNVLLGTGWFLKEPPLAPDALDPWGGGAGRGKTEAEVDAELERLEEVASGRRGRLQ